MTTNHYKFFIVLIKGIEICYLRNQKLINDIGSNDYFYVTIILLYKKYTSHLKVYQIKMETKYEFEKNYKIKNGLCLIINMINFDEREDLRRDGSEENAKLVKEAFEHVGFEVYEYCDLNDYQIISLIDEEVDNQKSDLFRIKGCVCFIYSFIWNLGLYIL